MASDFLFCEEEDNDAGRSFALPKWKLLIVDDEPDVHEVTKLVLRDFDLDQAELEFISAYSAAEAKQKLIEHPDIAVAFVDVVMETKHAGLDLVKYIRSELHNHLIRLVLRTGQPGEAPEVSVIRDYDINDYKNKTELTDIKLKTLMYTALRSFRDLNFIEQHKAGLEKIIAATNLFLECDTLAQFASAVLEQVAQVLGIQDEKIYCCIAINKDKETEKTDFKVLAASDKHNNQNDFALPNNIKALFEQAHNQQESIHGQQDFVGYFTTQCQLENLLYVSNQESLNQTQHDLLEFFSNNIAVVYDNINMREITKESQKELSYILGEAVEKRSKETGSHVKRVANYSYMLGRYYGLDKRLCQQIKLASPLHDVGKIGIPDNILNKPAKLDEHEWEIMKTHAQQGYDILSQSKNDILKLGAIISHQHHERYDGTGYPNGISGDDIDIAGRITALADVFDALASERCYKPAWPMEDVLKLLKEEKGKQFDPKLVDLLLENLDEFIEVRDQYPDPT